MITGATGGVGLALVKELLSAGYKVTVILRPNCRRALRLPKHDDLDTIECNLDQIDHLQEKHRFLGQYDIFFHLGWDYSREHNNVDKHMLNLGYTLNAINLAKEIGCSCFVGCGSQAEFGICNERIDESTPVHPETAYGIVKLCAGQLGQLYCNQLGMRFVWPRIISTYGPGDGEETILMYVIRQLLAGEEPELTMGEQIWDFLYFSDAAIALHLLAECENCTGIYCIGSGVSRPLKDYIEQTRDCIDRNLPLGFGKKPYAFRQVMSLNVDISKLKRDTGFIPQTDFLSGITKTINWCRTNADIISNGHGI